MAHLGNFDSRGDQPLDRPSGGLGVGRRRLLGRKASIAILRRADIADRTPGRAAVLARDRLQRGARIVDVGLGSGGGVAEAAVAILLANEPANRPRRNGDARGAKRQYRERGQVDLMLDGSVGRDVAVQRCDEVRPPKSGRRDPGRLSDQDRALE